MTDERKDNLCMCVCGCRKQETQFDICFDCYVDIHLMKPLLPPPTKEGNNG